MPHPPFLIPDHPDWHAEAGYSPTVARQLTLAYEPIRLGGRSLLSFVRAYAHVHHLPGAAMSRRQRLHVFHIIALAHAAVADYLEAEHWLDDTLDLADDLDDDGARIEILIVRGSVFRALLLLPDAIANVRACLEIMERLGDGLAPYEPWVQLDLSSQLAGFEFFMAEYEAAEGSIARARALIPATRARALEPASIEWVQALIYRQRGLPAPALVHGAAAAVVYTEQGHPVSASRIHTLVAETALDLAMGLPEGMDRSAQIKLAWPHIQLALQLARETHDETSRGLALLSRARYGRLAGRAEDEIATIERVVRSASWLDDPALLAQALTALGDALAGREGVAAESALGRYHAALTALRGKNLRALEVWPRRGILRAGEMHV
jgi:tetratricopeptide (TPR) repeat protein